MRGRPIRSPAGEGDARATLASAWRALTSRRCRRTLATVANIDAFVGSVQKKYGMRPLVPFQAPIEIGDVGYLQSGVWTPISTVRHRFGVHPGDVREEKDTRGVWEDRSGREVKFKVYAKGQTSKLIDSIADAKARAEIEFATARSFVFAAKGVTIRSATEFGGVIDAIRLAYHNRKRLPEDKRWDPRLAFIFAVAEASRFVAILADSANTTLAVMGKGKVGPPSAPAELTGGIEFGSTSNELQKVNQAPAPHCFYRAYRLKPSIFKRWQDERLDEVRFTRSRWLMASYDGMPLGLTPGATLGPALGRFGKSDRRGEGLVRISSASTPNFEETFEEV